MEHSKTIGQCELDMKAKKNRNFIFFVFFVTSVACTSIPAGAQGELECDAQYSGLIDEQGVDSFLNRYATEIGVDGLPQLPSQGTVCLDSPGGSFSQALRLYEVIRRSIAVTYVERGAQCNSACAVAFLAGRTPIGQGNTQFYGARILSSGGQVGFHAPFTSFRKDESFTGEQGNQIFSLAVEALAAANGIRLTSLADGPVMNAFLYNGFISTPPSELFKIETTSDAIFSGIEVRGLPFIETTNEEIITRVCDTAVALNVIDSIPRLLEGNRHAHDVISMISDAREQRRDEIRDENISFGIPFTPYRTDFGVNRYGKGAEFWMINGYPSTGHMNEQWVCVVSVNIRSDYFETWSNAKDFLSIPNFEVSLFAMGKSTNLSQENYSTITNFLNAEASYIFSRFALPNWAALPSDTSLGSN